MSNENLYGKRNSDFMAQVVMIYIRDRFMAEALILPVI